jgi:hypothetical protein
MELPMHNNMQRHQMGLIYELVKLALLALSGYLTYGFLSHFLGDFWFRLLALVLYEGGLLFWHYVHHYKVETPRQHMFSRNMERLSLAAVGSAAGYQLLTLVSRSFGDALPTWTHTAVEITTAVVFMLQLFAFTKWEKLSHYYAAVERYYNRQMGQQSTALVAAFLPATGTANSSVKVVESDEKLAGTEAAVQAIAGPNDADELAGDIDTANPTAKSVFQMAGDLLDKATSKPKYARLEDRREVLSLLSSAHPDYTQQQLADGTGLSLRSVQRWQRELEAK